jgi:hypothetical protein
MNPLQIKPNVPITVSLVDPEGQYDPEYETVTYQTTKGQILTLPHRAAVALNLLEPQPGEELVITRIWSGKRSEQSEWTVALALLEESLPVLMEEGNPDALEAMQEAARREFARQMRIAAGQERVCLGCGCSESRSCSGLCIWATRTLCSRCV